MADKPFIKWFTSDFLNGVADLEADEIGVYAVILSLLADRGAPIADDPKWLGRRCGTSTKRFNQIRARLIELGKLEARNDMLGNRRMIAEIEKRDGKSQQARAAAIARWHGDVEPELDLNGTDAAPVRAPRARQSESSGPKSGEKVEDKNDLISPKNDRKPRKSANSDDADAFSPSRARASQTPEARIIQPNDSPRTPARDPDPEPAPSRLDDRDLQALFDACSVASGYNPIQPGHIAKAYDMIKGWRDAGIDFDAIVIPTIQSVIASSPDPTSSFARFDKRIRHEHARSGVKPKAGSAAYKPPASPIIEGVEGEDERCAKIRRILLDRMGASLYCVMCNEIRLEPVSIEEMGDSDKRRPIRVITKQTGFAALMNGEYASVMRNAARSQGFTDVW